MRYVKYGLGGILLLIAPGGLIHVAKGTGGIADLVIVALMVLGGVSLIRSANRQRRPEPASPPFWEGG